MYEEKVMAKAMPADEEKVKQVMEVVNEVKSVLLSKFNLEQQNHFIREIRQQIVSERTNRADELSKEADTIRHSLETL